MTDDPEDTNFCPPIRAGHIWEIWRANGVLVGTYTTEAAAWHDYELLCEDENQ